MLDMCISYLESKGLHVRGIFRVPTSLTVIKALKQKYDIGEDVNLAEIENPHVVAGLLMYILRQMDEPLVPFKLYDKLVALSASTAGDLEDEKERERDIESEGDDDSSAVLNRTANFGRDDIPIQSLRAFVASIPFENRFQLSRLVAFLDNVVSEGDANEATVGSVVHIFTPLLCRPAGCSWMSPTHIKSLQATKRVIRVILSKGAEIFTKSVMAPPSPTKEESDPQAARKEEDMEVVSEVTDAAVEQQAQNAGSNVDMEAHLFRNLCVVDVLVEDLVASAIFNKDSG